MQKNTKLKRIVLLLVFMISAAWCGASVIHSIDGYSAIQVKEGNVQHTPKGSSIQASINGHALTVVFAENLGQVDIELTTASGTLMDCFAVQTPNGIILFIPNAGDYIITFTLPNGDVYYGEFTVTE